METAAPTRAFDYSINQSSHRQNDGKFKDIILRAICQ